MITKNIHGQVLIVSAIVVGVVSLLIAGSLMLIGLSSLRGTTITAQAALAGALDNGCAEEALYRIRQLPSYTGSDSYAPNGNTCFFTVSDIGGNQRKINLASAVGNVIKKTEIILTVSGGAITIDSWQDVP